MFRRRGLDDFCAFWERQLERGVRETAVSQRVKALNAKARGFYGDWGAPNATPQPRDHLFPSSPVPPNPAGDRRGHSWSGRWGPGPPGSTRDLRRGLQQ